MDNSVLEYFVIFLKNPNYISWWYEPNKYPTSNRKLAMEALLALSED